MYGSSVLCQLTLKPSEFRAVSEAVRQIHMLEARNINKMPLEDSKQPSLDEPISIFPIMLEGATLELVKNGIQYINRVTEPQFL